MVHIQSPDRFNGFRWVAYVEDNHGCETIGAAFATELQALAQARKWEAEMERTGVVVGAVPASYES